MMKCGGVCLSVFECVEVGDVMVGFESNCCLEVVVGV